MIYLLLIGIPGWIVFGILAYGLLKNCLKEFLKNKQYVGYDRIDESYCILVAIFGPIGLIISALAVFLLYGELKQKIRLSFRMPKELKAGHGRGL